MEINTPVVGGLKNQAIFFGRKIKVFISSICGIEKYDTVRAKLKCAIEDTKLAEVYTFEGKGASTLPAGKHYTWALEDSDVCIFLIDNADGIKSGVQAEIDTVKKYNIKALYYFCDEKQKKKTALEESLMGAQFAKSKTVHSFAELGQDGASALIDDIVAIYHYYCNGKLVVKSDESDAMQSVEVVGTENYQLPIIPRAVLKNVDKCRNYLLEFMSGRALDNYFYEPQKTNELDDWVCQFLSILFEGKSIKDFNTTMYLDVLKKEQDSKYHQLVQRRWKAIQSYFAGDIEACINNLNEALDFAKNTDQPAWIINDILIDLRNQHWNYRIFRNVSLEEVAQKELNESNEEIYYPILDRIHESLHGEYIQELYKEKIESPYTVTVGNKLKQYGEMLASSFLVSMYNGSLTHILRIYEEIRDFAFYLSCKYDDWEFVLNLYKLAIFAGRKKEIKGIQDSYPEVLSKLTSEEALTIMKFCLNHPLKYERLNSQLMAFGAVGYFLNDKEFSYYEECLFKEIKAWLNCDKPVVFVGQSIFNCLSGVAYRISQDKLSEVCCKFIEKNYVRWYGDIFKLIRDYMNLQKMSKPSAQNLIQHVNNLLDNEDGRKQIGYAPTFLARLRNQSIQLTESMDKKVNKYFPEYYANAYKIETTQNEIQDMPAFVKMYTENIKKNNETQGMEGTYFGHSIREIALVRDILLNKEITYDVEIMDKLISVVADTLLISKENVSTKLDAIALLICIVIKYPEDYRRNQNVYEKLFEEKEIINADDCQFIAPNIDNIALKIGLQFLYIVMDKDTYSDILELMPYIRDNITTTIAVTRLIADYLETSETVTLPSKVEAIVLQNVLQWLRSKHLDIRWNATRILLTMTRNSENYGIVNHQLVNLIDSNNVYIKNLIMRHLYKINGITEETKKYIVSKCENDANFIVRMVCVEEKDKYVKATAELIKSYR